MQKIHIYFVNVCLTQFSLWLWLILLLTIGQPLHAAQDNPAEPFPTAEALARTTVPPADLIRLAERFRGAVIEPVEPAPPPQIGDVQSFRANNVSQNRQFTFDARLVAVGEHVYIWVEVGAAVDDAELERLAAIFDTRIYEPARALWGEEANPGIDGDPRVHIVFAHDLGAGTGAYFVRRNTFPASAVPESNEREMFFVNLDSYPVNLDSDAVAGALAHEFQHMIHANMNASPASWLNEGFSAFTELILGFGVGTNHLIQSFLLMPNTQLNSFGLTGARVADYGAGMLFTAYIYDHLGAKSLRELTGTAALRSAKVTDFDVLFADWVAANWIQDADGVYGYRLVSLPARPALRETVVQLPFTRSFQTYQYAADYIRVVPPSGAQALQISVDLPTDALLVPQDALSGQWAWYSNRGDLSHTVLRRSFDLRDVDSATLNYHTWYAIEADWDYVYVTASVDDGKTWTLLDAPAMSVEDPNGSAYGPGYTGRSGGWIEQTVSLDAFAGNEVLVQFELVTDDSINEHGLLLDDVSVPEIGYASDFEIDSGGWKAEGWIRSDNRLPQRAWVQVVQQVNGEARRSRWLVDEGTFEQTLALEPGTEDIVIIVAPFAPVTTVPTTYTIELDAVESP